MRADLEGQMSAVDLAALLEGTDGLGQSTLLPRHVRGVVDAEGTIQLCVWQDPRVALGCGRDVRIEEGELIDFELLQEIPPVLCRTEIPVRLPMPTIWVGG